MATEQAAQTERVAHVAQSEGMAVPPAAGGPPGAGPGGPGVVARLKRGGLLAGAATLLAGMLAKASEAVARAADGEPLIVSQPNTATGTTALTRSNPSATGDALRVTNTRGIGVYGSGTGPASGDPFGGSSGVYGTGNPGVWGSGTPGSGGVGVRAVGPSWGGRPGGRGGHGLLASGGISGLGPYGPGTAGVVAMGGADTGPGVAATGGSFGGIGVVGTGGRANPSDTAGPPVAPGVVGTGTTGVVGTAVREGIGVQGTSTTGTGVAGTSTTGTGVLGVGDHRGVAAQHPTAGTAAYLATAELAGDLHGALLVRGDLTVTGDKAAAVPLPDGTLRRLYALESPESWFEDFGTGTLAGGQAAVALDPAFAATVRTERYHVFLTPQGDSRGLYVSHKSPTGFEVREQQGGTSSVAFDYRVVAHRKDRPGVRLAPVTAPAVRPEAVPAPPTIPEVLAPELPEVP